ncbi:hypothetical protein [Caulobacter vibrioides]|uniref:hypothetical protein n=1 Tax=Caulobacter vibrioides TaxID=155892 RepID=UPI000BB49065|nr:hypothetical protein [Caulobacter vibrioides]ATC25220.1 hypothetical protein CA608_12110 [Caulobacter vibrioides]PLR13990.1 hypothetical protein CVUC_05410 [Caulobacter vibrioides]
MGQRVSLSDYVTDTNIQPLYDDPGISAGTLFLMDGAHSKGAFTGVPANGGSIPNIAASAAAELTGAAPATLNGLVTFARESTSTLLVERTTKLGLHGLPSQSAQTIANNGWFFTLPNAIRDYIWGLVPTGGLYVSLMSCKTREYTGSPAAPQSHAHIHSATAATTNYLLHSLGGQAPVPISGSQLIGKTPASPPAVNTSMLSAIGVSNWTGTKPSSGANTITGFGVGIFGSWSSLNINKGDGIVLYRIKVEDLTNTRRANNGAGGTLAEEYAAALARDQEDFNTFFGVGGKFNGDTWTNPATFP